MDWSPEHAIRQFKFLSDYAFAERNLLKVPVFKNAAQLFCSYRYKPEGIESVLQKAFGQTRLFGHGQAAKGDRVKVGVVAGMEAVRQRSVVFANYSRDSAGRGKCSIASKRRRLLIFGGDSLQRADDPEDDLKIWEA